MSYGPFSAGSAAKQANDPIEIRTHNANVYSLIIMRFLRRDMLCRDTVQLRTVGESYAS